MAQENENEKVLVTVSNDVRRVSAVGYMRKIEVEALKMLAAMYELRDMRISVGRIPGHDTNCELTVGSVLSSMFPANRVTRREITVEIEDGVVQAVKGIPTNYIVRVVHTETDGNDLLEGPFQVMPDGTLFVQECYTDERYSPELSMAAFDRNLPLERPEKHEA